MSSVCGFVTPGVSPSHSPSGHASAAIQMPERRGIKNPTAMLNAVNRTTNTAWSLGRHGQWVKKLVIGVPLLISRRVTAGMTPGTIAEPENVAGCRHEQSDTI